VGGRFRYALDPLSVCSSAGYAVLRWIVKPRVGLGFIHNHGTDLLLIPAALPLVLWFQHLLGWRTHNRPPDLGEIVMHLAIWGLISEALGPWLFHRGTADWRDLLAYAAGAIVGYVFWNRKKRLAEGPKSP
jgi:hypothetical protein